MGLIYIQGLFSSLFTSLAYIPAAIGFYIALRCLRFPDLTVEGSFIFGQSILAYSVIADVNPIIGILLAISGGAFLGFITGIQHVFLRIPSFVCGIITTFVVTTFNFKLLHAADKIAIPNADRGSGTSSIVLPNSGIFEWAYNADFSLSSNWGEMRIYQLLSLLIICMVIFLTTYFFLKSKFGLRMRAFGVHRHVAQIYEHKSKYAIVVGLIFTNILVAFSGAIFCQVNRLATIESGASLLIPLLSAVVIGEFCIDYLAPRMSRFYHSYKDLNYEKTPLLSYPFGLSFAPVLGFLIYSLTFIFIATIALPQLSNQSAFWEDTNNKYLITAFLIVLVLVIRKNDATNKSHPEDVI